MLRRTAVRCAVFAVVISAGVRPTNAQNQMACGAAVQQLQTYVNEVNAIAQYEYNRGIAMRCGYNGYCAQSLMQQLAMWYSQQSSLVNQWYTTIANACSSTGPGRTAARRKRTDPSEEIEDVEDLDIDDEDKTVRIRIPSKPSGYRSSRSR